MKDISIERFSRKKDKGVTQIDFVIAASIFIITFALSMNFVTDYFSTIEDNTRIMSLRSEAFSLLGITEREPEPRNCVNNCDRIGLHTNAYRFLILVNNTGGNLIDELVIFNYSYLGFTNIDYYSTTIYNESNEEVQYNVSGDTIKFKINISANQEKWFTVYFDDDSNFTDRSVAISGTDSITERIFPFENISVIQYRKIQLLNASNYSSLKDNLNVSDFRITIYDVKTNETFFDYGGTLVEANVVAMKKFILYQNSTASIRGGKLVIKVW